MSPQTVTRWTPRRILGAVKRRALAAAARGKNWSSAAAKSTRAAREPHRSDEALIRELRVRNRLGLRSVLGDGPDVSLTSHGARVDSVHLAIESIGSGVLRPRALYLWLDDPDVAANPPRSLKRLVRRGLTIRLSENYGPHTKYYPYVQERTGFSAPLVTADDDILYPVTWLAGLAEAFAEHPDRVHCYRAHRIEFDGSAIKPYVAWTPCLDTEPSLAHFQTGVSGVLYPPAFLQHLHERGETFRAVCPRADDVWLHKCAVDLGMPVQQVRNAPEHYPMTPGSQESTLMAANVDGGANDGQIAATYSAEQLDLLRRVARGEPLEGLPGRS